MRLSIKPPIKNTSPEWRWVTGFLFPYVCAEICLHNASPLVVSSWLSALESTRWLQHLSVMLKAATLVCSAVEREGRPVLVHCSDGWDRTPQIVALAKVLLDPYYRTLEVGI